MHTTPQEVTGSVFDIQRFSIHDGPGIRTAVFLKGCSLRCFWCHNPESIRPQQEIQFYPDRCIGCGECVTVCQQGAQRLQDGIRIYERERCIACGRCVETCFAEAMVLTSRQMTVEQVMEEVLRDRTFYKTSGGGVTISGGEPVLQNAFALAILVRCKEERLHTAIETAANCHWDALATLLPATDLVMMDIKHLNPDKHRAATGVTNERILSNAQRLAQTDLPIIFRIPVVPSVNDTPEEIGAITSFIRHLADLRGKNGQGGNGDTNISLELLPFHRMAADKYRSLGLEYHASRLEPPSKEKMAALAEAARASGVAVFGR